MKKATCKICKNNSPAPIDGRTLFFKNYTCNRCMEKQYILFLDKIDDALKRMQNYRLRISFAEKIYKEQMYHFFGIVKQRYNKKYYCHKEWIKRRKEARFTLRLKKELRIPIENRWNILDLRR